MIGADPGAGMANRLCFDIGLHLDCQNDGLPEREIQIRHMTLFACVIYDKCITNDSSMNKYMLIAPGTGLSF